MKIHSWINIFSLNCSFYIYQKRCGTNHSLRWLAQSSLPKQSARKSRRHPLATCWSWTIAQPNFVIRIRIDIGKCLYIFLAPLHCLVNSLQMNTRNYKFTNRNSWEPMNWKWPVSFCWFFNVSIMYYDLILRTRVQTELLVIVWKYKLQWKTDTPTQSRLLHILSIDVYSKRR